MAYLCFVKILLLFHLICWASASPFRENPSKAHIGSNERKLAIPDVPEESGIPSAVAEQVAESDDAATQSKPDALNPLRETGGFPGFASLMTPETLQFLQMAMPPPKPFTVASASPNEDAAKVAPPEEPHRIVSLQQKAESVLHDQDVKPQDSLLKTGVNKSQKVISTVTHGNFVTKPLISLRNYLMARQIDRLQEIIAAELTGLRKSLSIFAPVKGAVDHIFIGRRGSAAKSPEVSPEETTTDGNPPESSFPQTPSLGTIVSESSVAGNVDSDSPTSASGTDNEMSVDFVQGDLL